MEPIKLDNGKNLLNAFGKYEPNVSFVYSDEDKAWFKWWGDASDPVKQAKLNFNVPKWDGSASFMFGRYWQSKKGTNCFAPSSPENASHIFVRVDWGGSYAHTRGRIELQKCIYTRRASSNGGGTGYTYYIVPADNYANEYSEDDI